MTSQHIMRNTIRLTILASLCACLTACTEHPRESAAISDETWQDRVYPMREALAASVGDEGAAVVSLDPTGWATITGKFVYDNSSAPSPSAIQAGGQDAAFCGAVGLVDQSLVVDPATLGIANIFVFLRTKGWGDPHESYSPDAVVTLANNQCRFEPHVLGIWLPQTLKVTNDDPMGHNTNCTAPGDPAGSFNDLIPAGGNINKSFSRSQDRPADVNCGIHPWMTAKVLPRDNPYFATTDAEGNFRIENVPAGIELEFQVYHERSKNLNANSGWSNGRFKVTLNNDEERDMGTIKVSPALLGG
jgi:hypothetical protein